MKRDIKVHVIVTEGDVQIAHMSAAVSGGRHEFTFALPIKVNGRHFEGFALEMWLDQTARSIVYNEHIAKRPGPSR
jgi:hypothetical protein